MITAYNPLTNPQMANSLSQPEKLPVQAGQLPLTNSNFFASIITQLLTQMELQSKTDSGIANGDSSLLMDNNQTGTQTGMDPLANQSYNPFDIAQLMGSTTNNPLNFTGLLNNLGINTYNNQIPSGEALNMPLETNTSLNPYKMAGINQTIPSSYTDGSLQFHSIDPNLLNGVLAGKLQGMGEVFVKAGQQYNVDPALLAAIAQHETGNGKSQAANTKNNIAGMMGATGLKSYTSVEDSINDMASNIGKYYLGSGLTTISKIGAKYAPVGAGNDPAGLNNYWVSGVTNYFNQLRTQSTANNTFASTV